MTIKQLKERGLKVLFLKEDGGLKRNKWNLIAHFKYLNKENSNFVYENGVDMKIYYYTENQCFVNIDCMKRMNGINKYFTIQEIIDYDNFFNHIFDVDEYMQ